jgi:tRNA-uridine 2-sulfurtransferase
MASKGTVLVAMSGGVDSSVAACLLAEQGYDVMGSHMSLVHLDGVEHGCCGPRARADAAEVARLGGFPFEVADLSGEFERTVLADFVQEHEAGRTPNPCVRCNEQIKFGAFLERADALRMDFVATGHYVRSRRDTEGRWHLFRGRDPSKDQSYVLHTLGQRELGRALFPCGVMTKAATREHAQRLGLPVAGKPDSQEVCFVPGRDHGAFLSDIAPHLVRAGDVVDAVSGERLASHDGTFRFTVGQRRGLGVSFADPRYVVDVDAAAGRVLVGPGELLARRGLVADRVHWVSDAPPTDGPFEGGARIRYRGEDVPSVIEPRSDGVHVEFRRPQRGVAPGQSVAFYRGAEMLGGGRIMEAVR